MPTLSDLKPTDLWCHFEQICSKPHASKHEEALASWIVGWATERGLHAERDAAGNVLLRKPATPGCEDSPGVILQAHLDMVPQKNTATVHDFLTDPIRPRFDGDWVAATDTTLGADNGIGLAATLAVFGADDLTHGPLEALLTVDEETGMTGAFALRPGWLRGTVLVNTDSEQEGEVYAGCAGGVDVNTRLPIDTEAVPAGAVGFRLMVTGLRGGHSGVDVHLERGNANKLLARLLSEAAAACGLRLADLRGGSLRNAIPREAEATLVMPGDRADALRDQVACTTTAVSAEIHDADPDLRITLESAEVPAQVFTGETQRRVIAALMGCPNGVLRMSSEIEGVVETSTNLGVVETRDGAVHTQCLVRSLIDTGRDHAAETVRAVFELAGGEVALAGAYPGWRPNPDSAAIAAVRSTYEQLFGAQPKIMVIHAGLECGLFSGAYPHLDMVSIGPTIKFPHSPAEKVHIPSVARFWELLVALLARWGQCNSI